jgi:hypothetical protein
MNTKGIPFQNIGISSEVSGNVIDIISRFIAERPNAPIDVQSVCEESGYAGSIVKKVFYTLLAFRRLKATFLARHRTCGNIVSTQQSSAELVWEKARDGQLQCYHCSEPLCDPEDIEVQIIFWKPGANAEQ